MQDPRDSSSIRWKTVAIVALLFIMFSFWTASIPGSNESHYLCKAKYWWEPEWCSRDLFLSSSNPHLVFYVVLGWMAKWMSLEAVTIIGRITGYIALACGWDTLCRALRLNARATFVAAVLLLVSAATISLSGEWLVGGIESKVYSYAGVFFGFGAFLERRWIAAGVGLGIAIAFHPLVGAWSVVALGLAVTSHVAWTSCLCYPSGRVSVGELVTESSQHESTDWKSMLRSRWNRNLLFGAALCGVISLTGLVPALSSLGGDPADSLNATFIQVFYRLRHHLHPDAFPVRSYVIHVSVLLLATYLSSRRIPSPELRLFRRCVWAAALIALVGWFAGRGLKPEHFGTSLFNVRMTILKFYPFRVIDALVPVFGALMVAQAWSERGSWMPRSRWIRWQGGLTLVLALFALEYGRGLGAARYLPQEREQDWLDVCRWVRDHSADDALFVTPNESWAFKWYAHRAEYVAFKDCPQDAASLNEWNARLRWLARWAERGFVDTVYSEAEIRELVKKTKATHFITRRPARLDSRELYSNDSYLVYELQ